MHMLTIRGRNPLVRQEGRKRGEEGGQTGARPDNAFSRVVFPAPDGLFKKNKKEEFWKNKKKEFWKKKNITKR